MQLQVITDVLIFLALTGAIPVIILLIELFLVGFSRWHTHFSKCAPYTPRTAIIVPSWNEADTVKTTINQLLHLDYPPNSLRIYIIDDASTDHTFSEIKEMQGKYPGRIFYHRREIGGQGKAHVLNTGLKLILADPWAEAILIIDADVSLNKQSLCRMTRHLADPNVGAVTAYIKEGNIPGNLVSHFIAAEYIISQAAARRAQNVIGALACLAGGAQLHSRANIEAIGGKIDTSTLAEDTYTTIITQLGKKLALFEGNAIAVAEEPGSLTALWKQRFRWARGNVQITRAFRHIWFQPKFGNLGGLLFGSIWFCTMLMPFFMIISSVALLCLLYVNAEASWRLFSSLGALSTVSYLFFVMLILIMDPTTMKRAWFAAIIFPGIISLLCMGISFAPQTFDKIIRMLTTADTYLFWRNHLLFIIYSWVSVCMFFGWILCRLDRIGASQKITNFFLLIIGYGPILCTITLLSFVAEFTKVDLKWDKTERLKMTKSILAIEPDKEYKTLINQDLKYEKNLFWYEMVMIIIIIILLGLRYYYAL